MLWLERLGQRHRPPPDPRGELLHIIVFSKDRASQLDLLLSSMKRFFREWRSQRVSILFTASNAGFARGYDRVQELHPEFLYVRERAFKDDLLRILAEGRRPYTSFLVDDDVFIDDLTLDSEEFRAFATDPRILCLSCRMCPRLNYFYLKDMEVKPPPFGPGRTWRWKGLRGDWGYPMSIASLHIFRTADIEGPMRRGDYRNPNTFEKYGLVARPPRRPLMICHEEAKVFCVTVNRVQTVNQNRSSGAYPPEELNALFLGGRRLSCARLHEVRKPSAHGEIEYEWDS